MKPDQLIVGLVAALNVAAANAEETALTAPSSANSVVTFMVGQVPADRSPEDIIKVYVGAASGCCDGRAPMAGHYVFVDGAVTFDPAFEFLEGYPYTIATWQGALTEFLIPAEAELAPPEVLAIYPSGQTLPENTLRFYIQFSTAMMPHRSEEFIRLVDAEGRTDDQAFMSFTQELWNADRSTLTLLMDPGRIKRGVTQNQTLGPALEESQSYSIVIDEGWPAANGLSVAPPFERVFDVSAPLRDLPTVDTWAISPPQIGTREPISITFDRPFDRFQTLSSISLRLANDRAPIEGTATLGEGELVWRFVPDQPWRTADLELVVDARLEDVAGNNFRDTLDHALGTQTHEIDQIVFPLTAEPQSADLIARPGRSVKPEMRR